MMVEVASGTLPLSDQDLRLMSAVARGETEASRALALRVVGRVRRLAGALLRGSPDVDDAVQTSLLEILKSARSYRGDAQLEKWSDRITVRTTLRLARSRRSDSTRTGADVNPDELPTPHEEERDANGASTARPVADYVEELPEPMRTAFHLRHALDYGIDEIARETGVSPNTVKDRLVRGRELLRKRIRRDRMVLESKGGEP